MPTVWVWGVSFVVHITEPRLGARVLNVWARRVDDSCAALCQNELALEFSMFGRVRLTTIAHFYVKMNWRSGFGRSGA